MKLKSAEFVLSATSPEHYPFEGQPEILLSGRSNVGKSSFINSMLNRKGIARVSSKPGKTQTLNFFHVNKAFYFVDVPGYGYAKVPKPLKKAFGEMIEKYIQNRKTLKAVVLLVDMRHKPSEDDVVMYNFLKYFNVPMIIVATKLDKVKSSMRGKQEKIIKETLGFDKQIDTFVAYSSETKAGKDQAWKALSKYLFEDNAALRDLMEGNDDVDAPLAALEAHEVPVLPEDAYGQDTALAAASFVDEVDEVDAQELAEAEYVL